MPRRKPLKRGKIEKEEDIAWRKWFNSIKEEEHNKYLARLGLDKEDIEEWHHLHGKLDSLEEELLKEETKPRRKRK